MEVESFPEGTAFFDLVAVTEEACAKVTVERIPELGEKAPECQKRLGDALSLLYREACCANGCPGDDDDHFGQHIAGRVVSHSLASYQLMCRGYYDESFSLTRNLAEMANLLFLFVSRPESLPDWRNADEKTRRLEYGPLRVRLKLEESGVPVPFDETRYKELCEVGVHLGPQSSPQAHNPWDKPTLGSVLQEAGLVAALNELSGATGVCIAGLIPMLNLGDRGKILRTASVKLLRSVGGVDLRFLRAKLWSEDSS